MTTPPAIPASTHVRLALLMLLVPCLLACVAGMAPTSWTGAPNPLADYNAAYNCPTPSPVPTVCVPGPTPANALTPTPLPVCTDPLPTMTPYGRWASPGDRNSANLFRRGQSVYIGPLRLTLTGYQAIPMPGGQAVAHTWTFDVANVSSSTTFSITWPLQATMRAITAPDGTNRVGNWLITAASARAGGNPALIDPTPDVYPPGAHKQVVLPFAGVPGRGVAAGFIPDPTGEGAQATGQGTPTGHGDTERPDLAGAADIYWFTDQDDPYCPAGNISGPPRQGDGGAVYAKPRPTAAPAVYGYFAGWPTVPTARVAQGFGCTGFPEISSRDCYRQNPSTPYFHSGVDLAIAPQGSPLFAVAHARVTYIGVSYGRACDFPGSDAPHTNLGWVVILQAGPWTLKYGHTQLHSERVQVGQEVAPGDVLALMGSTGCSTGSHVHFMVQDPSGAFQNPMRFIGPNRSDPESP
jgi:murein DD-endopeptidase MepM/ murein hydrolase activator NlpD